MSPSLQVHRVSVTRGSAMLLDNVSLDAAPGQLLVIVGPNGAGKSTLLGVMANDIVPDSGEVLINGRSLHRVSVAEQATLRAVLPQQTLLQFGFRSREVVAMGRTPLPAAVQDQDELVVARSLETTESLHLAERRFPTLSGGEQTRVSLARVLAQETPLILLDEPTAALDIRHQQMVMRTARDLARHGRTIVAILHDLNLAMTYADRIAVLAEGRVMHCDDPWHVAGSGVLSQVFRCPIAVTRHPHLPCPLILSLDEPSPAERQAPDTEPSTSP